MFVHSQLMAVGLIGQNIQVVVLRVELVSDKELEPVIIPHQHLAAKIVLD